MTLGWGQRSNIINFGYHVHFKDFIPNFVCILTNERYKTYQTGFSFCPLDHFLGVGLLGAGVPRGGQKNIFKHGHVAYQIEGDDKQNRMQVKFSS